MTTALPRTVHDCHTDCITEIFCTTLQSLEVNGMHNTATAGYTNITGFTFHKPIYEVSYERMPSFKQPLRI